jgi:hypothetical protein
VVRGVGVPGVPMIGRADRDRVDVFHLEEPAVVAQLSRLTASFGGCEINVRLVDVADRHDLGVLVGQKRIEHLIAAVADANKAQPYAIVRAQDAAAPESGTEPGRRGGFSKLAARHRAHLAICLCRGG